MKNNDMGMGVENLSQEDETIFADTVAQNMDMSEHEDDPMEANEELMDGR